MVESIEKALIEQFGETFREFNNATQALNEWQEEHKAEVAALTAHFKETAAAVESVRASIEAIKNDCAAIPPAGGAAEEAAETGNRETRKLLETMGGFAELRTKAADALPVIRRELDRIGEGLATSADGIEGTKERITAAAPKPRRPDGAAGEACRAQIEKTAAELGARIEGVLGALKSAAETELAAVRATVEESARELKSAGAETRTQMARTAEAAAAASEKTIAETAAAAAAVTNEVKAGAAEVQHAARNAAETAAAAVSESVSGAADAVDRLSRETTEKIAAAAVGAAGAVGGHAETAVDKTARASGEIIKAVAGGGAASREASQRASEKTRRAADDCQAEIGRDGSRLERKRGRSAFGAENGGGNGVEGCRRGDH